MIKNQVQILIFKEKERKKEKEDEKKEEKFDNVLVKYYEKIEAPKKLED